MRGFGGIKDSRSAVDNPGTCASAQVSGYRFQGVGFRSQGVDFRFQELGFGFRGKVSVSGVRFFGFRG